VTTTDGRQQGGSSTTGVTRHEHELRQRLSSRTPSVCGISTLWHSSTKIV
jgi:hypothetical protein